MNAVLSLGESASGPAIHEIVEKSEGWPVSAGALYTTLDRLISQGHVEALIEEPATQQRGAKPKTFYRVTPLGQTTLDALTARRASARELTGS
jgi:DNA-binding PadR family transcriptional regulator